MSSRLDWQSIIILTGMILIITGYASPIITSSEDTVFYWDNRSNSSARFILYMLIITSTLMALRKHEMLWIIGLLTLAILANDFRIVFQVIYDTEWRLSWGWIPLFTGSLMLILPLFLGEDRERLFNMKLFQSLIPPIDAGEDQDDTSDVTEEEQKKIDSPPESML